MRIFSYRVNENGSAFASNSSSSHYFVLLKGERAAFDNDLSPTSTISTYPEYFGGDTFELTRLSEINLYMLAQSYESLNHLPSKVRDILVKNVFNLEILGSYDDLGVDHQSQINLPLDFRDNKTLDAEWIESVLNFLGKYHIAVAGGSDNSDEINPLFYDKNLLGGFELPFTDKGSKNIVARYDNRHKYWTLFDRSNGTKIRLCLEINPSIFDEKPAKNTEHILDDVFVHPDMSQIDHSDVPELVDLKITDYCTFGCRYCYQSSTKEGSHADTWQIKNILDNLSEHKVFEVAIGGGEPTQHPDFLEIIKYARNVGIIPNVTTRNLEWLTNPALRKEILQTVGQVAFSVSNPREMTKINTLVRAAQYEDDMDYIHRVNYHIVMGTVTQDVFRAMLEYATENWITVTLLGFKTVGFGEEYQSHKSLYKNYDWWMDTILEVQEKLSKKNLVISIDAVMVEQYKDVLPQVVDMRRVDKCEGQYSCYIDAVQEKVAISSYTDEESLILPMYKDVGYSKQFDIKEQFHELHRNLRRL